MSRAEVPCELGSFVCGASIVAAACWLCVGAGLAGRGGGFGGVWWRDGEGLGIPCTKWWGCCTIAGLAWGPQVVGRTRRWRMLPRQQRNAACCTPMHQGAAPGSSCCSTCMRAPRRGRAGRGGTWTARCPCCVTGRGFAPDTHTQHARASWRVARRMILLVGSRRLGYVSLPCLPVVQVVEVCAVWVACRTGQQRPYPTNLSRPIRCPGCMQRRCEDASAGSPRGVVEAVGRCAGASHFCAPAWAGWDGMGSGAGVPCPALNSAVRPARLGMRRAGCSAARGPCADHAARGAVRPVLHGAARAASSTHAGAGLSSRLRCVLARARRLRCPIFSRRRYYVCSVRLWSFGRSAPPLRNGLVERGGFMRWRLARRLAGPSF